MTSFLSNELEQQVTRNGLEIVVSGVFDSEKVMSTINRDTLWSGAPVAHEAFAVSHDLDT